MIEDLRSNLRAQAKILVEATGKLIDIINNMTIEDYCLVVDGPVREELADILEEIASGLRVKRKDVPANPRVVIKLEGGLPGEVGADRPVDLIILDYDIEGCDEDELTEVNGENCCLRDYCDLGNEKEFVDENWVGKT